MPSHSDPASAAAPPTAVRWRLLALLFVVCFLAYVLRMNISVAGTLMMDELRLSEIQMGWVFGAFTLAYALFQFPGGLFGEWLGCRAAVACIGLAWGALTVLTGWLPGRSVLSGAGALATLVVVRFLMGAAQAPVFPATAASIETWFPRLGWALPNGLLSSGLTLGAAATSPLVAWLMVTVGWRASFYWTAPGAFLVVAVWWWYARDDPATHPRTNPAERALIAAGRPPEEGGLRRDVVLRLLRNRNVLLLALSYLCMNYVFYIFFSWFYIYLVEVRKFSLLEGGVYGALPWLVGAVGATLGGVICDRLCRRIGPRWGCRLPAMVSLVLVGGCLFAGASADNPYVAVIILSICFGFTQSTEGAFWAGTSLVAGRHTSPATGILNTGGNLGGVISTPIIPVLVAWIGWVPALATGTVFALAGAALWLWIEVDRPMQAD
jgi:MFS transporter, ACS family, glucarate transporter